MELNQLECIPIYSDKLQNLIFGNIPDMLL